MHNTDNLITVLMDRDGLSKAEAIEHINDAVDLVLSGVDPEEVLLEEFGLEPDYIFDLLEYCR